MTAAQRLEHLIDKLEGKKLTRKDKVALIEHWNAYVDEECDNDPVLKTVMERLFLGDDGVVRSHGYET